MSRPGYLARLRAHRRLVALVACLVAPLAPAWGQTLADLPTPPRAAGRQSAPNPRRPAPDAWLPGWLSIHGSQRTRFETVDHRYGATEQGGEQQLAFRTRLRVSATTTRAWTLAELEDARVDLNDEGSTLNTSHVTRTKVLQLHGGVAWNGLGGATLRLQLEGGRSSRDFGSRRLVGRNVYRNFEEGRFTLTLRPSSVGRSKYVNTALELSF